MKRATNSRKISIAVITGLLTAGLSVSVLAAPEGFGGGGQMGPGGNAMMPSGEGQFSMERTEPPEMQEGERPELPEMQEGECPESPEMQEGERLEPPEMQEGERPEPPEMQEGECPEPPENQEGEYPEPPEEPADGQRPPMDPSENGEPGGGKGGMINIEAVAEAISMVEDEETQTLLSDLLAAYQNALDAEKEGLDMMKEGESTDSGDIDLDSLRDAVMEARDALAEALEEAGVTVENDGRPATEGNTEGQNNGIREDSLREGMPVSGSVRNAGQNKSSGGDSVAIQPEITVKPSESRIAAEDTGFFARIKNAISDFFGKFTE